MAPIYMSGVVAFAPVQRNLLATRYMFFAAGANLIHQANFCAC
jgi:hypothetical protein